VDVTGAVLLIVPMLLAVFLATGVAELEVGMYGVCLMAALPCLGPFLSSLRRHPANLQFVLLFTVLAIATAAAFARVAPGQATLQAKALAATAVWSSIYIVVFSSLRTQDDARRLAKWIHATCLTITGSVYASVLLHGMGLRFGEVLQFSDGTARVFGPLGDQVGFVLVLPVLTSLAASSPVMFGIHLGALFLTATRGAVLCLIVGVVGYLLVAARSRGRARRRPFAVAGVLLVGVVVFLSPISAVVMGRLVNEPIVSGVSYRLTAIETGARVFLDNPVLGLGFNGFGAARPAVYEDWTDTIQAENGLSRTTNQLLQTATDGGALALLVLVLFVICTCRSALRVARSADATPALGALQLWLIAIMVGNQGALWLLSDTATGFFVFAVAGMTARMSVTMADQRVAARPRFIRP
jgi:O-antigen ligase